MTSGRPALAGLTVLVPRAREQAGELSALLRARGAEALEVPTIEIRPLASTAELDRSIEDLAAGRFHWLVLTSVNGVTALRARVDALGLDPLPKVGVAAVGPATEAALRDWGVVPDLVADPATTAALGQAFPTPDGSGEVLLARADLANPELGVALRAKGWRTTEVVAYHTVPMGAFDPAARRRLDGGEVDWVAFTASSTVEGFLRGYGGPPPPGVRVAAIGPVTADAARSAGMRVAATAAEHTIPGLVAAIEHAVTDRPGPGGVG
ncbi:MAG TPA: uroporphyrinogen-III synthase [Actinomycetes bacterium]|nr:uroporphyrinogen-III synthase [Actinomycetes bacterium]